MISKKYEKADFDFIEFNLDDVITKSSVVTTHPSTTLPATTSSGGVSVGTGGDIYFDFSDLFGN